MGQHQHPQRPQSGKGSSADMAQVVASQLQQPGAMWDAPGNVLEALVPAVHQVRGVITNALMGARLRALNTREKGDGQIKGRKGKVKDNRTHAVEDRSRRKSSFLRKGQIADSMIKTVTVAASENQRANVTFLISKKQKLQLQPLLKPLKLVLFQVPLVKEIPDLKGTFWLSSSQLINK